MSSASPAPKPAPTRVGTALLAFLVGVFLTLSGFALGVITDRALTPTNGREAAALPPVIPTIPVPPTDTVPAGAPTSTPRPVPTPVPTVTPSPRDAATNTKPARDTTPEQLREEFAEFWKAFDLLQQSYFYRPLDEQKLVYGAIKGFVGAAGDDYTQFLTPDENKAYQDAANGNFVGLGVYTETTPDGIRLTGIIPNGPAAEAGLMPDDIIIAVDGTPVGKDVKADDIRKLLRGPEGSTVVVTVKRSGGTDTRDLTVTRRRVVIPAVTLTILPDNTAHLVVTAFNDHAREELNAAFDTIRAKKVRGVVLDLRDNGGGYVTEARQLLGQFLPKDSVAMLEDRRPTGGQLTPVRVESGKDDPLDVPLVVLVNGGTASASEIIAGALQDYGRAELVGVKTFGKGSEQVITPFANGASLRVTVANWYTPKQRVVQKQGLQPDVTLEQPTVTRQVGKDAQLDKALTMLRERVAK